MAQRVRGNPRCWDCGLTPATCLCAELPRVRTATPLAVVQHARERWKPTNTGRLLARMVEGAALLPHGIAGRPFEPGPLAVPDVEWRVLYPREDAAPLEAGARIGLVLLDGTWPQAARMSRRVPIVAGLPCVALPAGGPPPIWTVRTQRDERGMSTFEAGLRALELLEGAEAVAPLREAFARITARLLFLKGRLRSPDVPAVWRT
jgi:DTW domain-containing protein YfiP